MNIASTTKAHTVFCRMWEDIAPRPSGPFGFGFLLQPAMAAIVALHDGAKDPHAGRFPYLSTVVHVDAERKACFWAVRRSALQEKTVPRHE